MEISCGCLIIHDKKLLICRPKWDRPDWNIPKGKMDDGETYLSAAIRETLEETNIDLSIVQKRIQELGLMPYLKNKKLYLYLVEIDSVPLLKCNSFYESNGGLEPEMVDYKWIDLDEYPNYMNKGLIIALDLIKDRIINFIGEDNES